MLLDVLCHIMNAAPGIDGTDLCCNAQPCCCYVGLQGPQALLRPTMPPSYSSIIAGRAAGGGAAD